MTKPCIFHQELLTVCEIHGIEITHEGYTNEHPFLVITVSRDQDIPTILNRLLLVSAVFEVKSL